MFGAKNATLLHILYKQQRYTIMSTEQKKSFQKSMIPVKKVDVKGTLELLEVGQEVYILFKDAKPSTLRTTSMRLKDKKFEVSELGLMDRTRVIRIL